MESLILDRNIKKLWTHRNEIDLQTLERERLLQRKNNINKIVVAEPRSFGDNKVNWPEQWSLNNGREIKWICNLLFWSKGYF